MADDDNAPQFDEVDDETARLFRENDTLGDSSSFWYRCTRFIFEKQSPVGKMTLLTTGPTKESQVALGVFTFTRNNRLIYWPALTPANTMMCSDGEVPAFDHITLELPSQRFHLTAYDEAGNKVPVVNGLRTCPIGEYGISGWFKALVKVDVLETQDTAIQRKIPVPEGHLERLTKWMDNFARQLAIKHTMLPVSFEARDYIYYSMFVAGPSFDNENISAVCEAIGHRILDEYVTGCDEKDKFLIQGTRFQVGDCDLVIVTACPPGRLKQRVAIQFARRRLRQDKIN